jgi:hypothetical protein
MSDIVNLVIDRFTSDRESTISLVFVDGQFVCFGLEDEHRTKKVFGETRIPAGIYDVCVRTWGGFHQRYSQRLPYHQGMLEICNVPDFADILIHIGNSEKDTAGCLIVGMGCYSAAGNMSLQASAVAYELLYKKVIAAALDDRLRIAIINNDSNI